MRTLKYRMEIDRFEGYVITNSERGWQENSSTKALTAPPLKIYDAPDKHHMCSSVFDYVRAYEDADQNFLSQVKKAVKGESKKWILTGIRINKDNVTLAFANKNTCEEETAYIKRCTSLKFIVEGSRENDKTQKFLIDLSGDHNADQWVYVAVTEPFISGKRRIIFNLYGNPQTVDSSDCDSPWTYAYVTEYR